MSVVSHWTDHTYFVKTWIEKNNNCVKKVDLHDADIHHVVEIEQGATLVRDVKLNGCLPNGIGNLAFICSGTKKPDWEIVIKKLTVQSPQQVKCEMEVCGGSGVKERIQCTKVAYKNPQTSSKPVWTRCYKNLPLECEIKIT